MQYPTKAAVEERARNEAFEAATQHGIDNILHEYKDVPRSDANIKGIKEICAEFLGVAVGEIAPDLPTFRSAVEADPTLLKRRLALMPTAQQKLKILDEIEALLTGVMSPLDLRSELKKLSFWSLEQLQARRQQIIERQRLSKLSTKAIKQELDAGRPAPGRYHPYDTLPVELTASELKIILRSHKANSYLRRFGAAQLNDKLSGRI